MNDYTLEIETLSDTVFSMGAGVSGSVDVEIQHDESGLPALSGRSIKGLLVNMCSEILYVLPAHKLEKWQKAAQRLFGSRGDLSDDDGVLICDATMAPDLRAALDYRVRRNLPVPSRQEVLNALTDIRWQTAINELGAPRDETLRATRVLLRGQVLYAPLIMPSEAGMPEKSLLAACVLSLRRAGLGRGRGKGKIQMRITERPLAADLYASTADKPFENLALTWFKTFKDEVLA